jgi:hypothetical protein
MTVTGEFVSMGGWVTMNARKGSGAGVAGGGFVIAAV